MLDERVSFLYIHHMIKTASVVDFNSFIAKVASALGFKQVNSSGIWNSPDVPHLVVGFDDLTNYSGYYGGESKMVYFCHPCEIMDCDDALSREDFLAKFGESIHDPKYKNSELATKVRVTRLLWYMYKLGEIPPYDVILDHSW